MTRYNRLLPLVFILWCSIVLGLATYILPRPTFAHEFQPLTPPVAAACYAQVTTCEGSTPDLRPLDGKSWLPQPPLLVTVGEIRAANRTALYDIPCVDGFADIFPCHDVDLLAFLPHTMIGGDTNNDMWGWADPVTGKEYAMVGARDGVAFVDISMPTAPRFLGKLPTHATRSSWRDLKVYQDHLFIVADRNNRHGMQVFDLTQLRTLTATTATTTTLLFTETAHYNEFSDAHNLAINEETGFAYAVGGETCDGGLHMVDIRNVNAPKNAGCYTEDGYIHDTQCVIYHGPDAAYQGRELCFNSSIAQFTVVDVTDKTTPTRISTIAVAGNVYMHQGWLTPDQHYFLLDDEMDEWFGQHNTRTYIFAVSDIDAPRFVDAYTAAVPSVDHNLYISGTYAYEANYTSGLRILDLKGLAQGQLSEAAFFDTYPESNDAVTAGAWTAYPFYKSGVVAISTIDRGLFLVKPQFAPDVIITKRQAALTLCTATVPPQQTTLPIPVQSRNGYTQPISLRTGQASDVIKATFTPTHLDLTTTAQATSTLTVSGVALATGHYTLTVEAVSPDSRVVDTTVISVALATTAATAPQIESPQGSSLQALAPIAFRWSRVNNASSYDLEIANEPTFASTIYTTTVTATSLRVAPPSTFISAMTPLTYAQRYYWRVLADNGCGDSVSSEIGQFQTPAVLFLPLIRQP